MKKNNKGFTLIELLAVIVILAIILVIASTNVIKSIKSSREKAKYTAAKEIVQIAEAYFATKGNDDCVKVEDMVTDGFLEEDVTNPLNGENRSNSNTLKDQQVCKSDGMKAQDDYEVNNNTYKFDGFYYKLK